MHTDIRLPVVLIVDDDAAVTRFMERQFMERTRMSVATSNSLSSARALLAYEDVRIDAVVADLWFLHGTDDPDHSLHDGLDLIRHAQDGEDPPDCYVVSVAAGSHMQRARARDLGIRVSGWFEKMTYSTVGPAPWDQVYREQVRKRMEVDDSLRTLADELQRPEGGGASDLSIGQLTDIMDGLTPVRESLLYGAIPAAEDAEESDEEPIAYTIARPIRAVCMPEDGEFVAREVSIGLLVNGRGLTVQDAFGDLSREIAAMGALLEESDEGDLHQYARDTKAMLREYLEATDADEGT